MHEYNRYISSQTLLILILDPYRECDLSLRPIDLYLSIHLSFYLIIYLSIYLSVHSVDFSADREVLKQVL